MVDRVVPMAEFLADVRREQHRKNQQVAISVYRDGSYQVWSQTDAEYAAAAGQADLLVTINLGIDLAALAETDAR